MFQNLEEIKNDKDTLEQEIVEFKEKVEKLTTEVGQLTKDKEAKMHRIKLLLGKISKKIFIFSNFFPWKWFRQFHEFFVYFFLLGNQKKAQESHDENVKMVEDALKEKEQVFTQSCSNLLKSFYLANFFFGFSWNQIMKNIKKMPKMK